MQYLAQSMGPISDPVFVDDGGSNDDYDHIYDIF